MVSLDQLIERVELFLQIVFFFRAKIETDVVRQKMFGNCNFKDIPSKYNWAKLGNNVSYKKSKLVNEVVKNSRLKHETKSVLKIFQKVYLNVDK